MAKRRRLGPVEPDAAPPALPAVPATRAPISQIAGDAATASALSQVSDELHRARRDGRLVLSVDLDRVDADHLVRDRMEAGEDDLASLMESLRARGQQTPIDVIETAPGEYGLISGWRRLMALRRLHGETGEDRFAQVLCLLRRPDGAEDAYIAMVEENEVRVGLSHYERARIAARAVELGLYDSDKAALLALFSTASRAKRSKIRAFLPIYRALDTALRFAPALPERLGLALSHGLRDDPELVGRLIAALGDAAPADGAAEQAVLARTLATKRTTPPPVPAPAKTETEGDVAMTWRQLDQVPSLVLQGSGVDDELARALTAWLGRRGHRPG